MTNDVVNEVTQQEFSNNKYYASTYIYILQGRASIVTKLVLVVYTL